ncbi:MAG: hypothetical protein LUC31_00715 [Coprobacillus sp.]|nr:hypothetical protein [Coprobacillus sp.]
METRKSKYQNYRLSLGQKNDDILKTQSNTRSDNSTLPMDEVIAVSAEENPKYKDRHLRNRVIYTSVVGALILALIIVLVVLAIIYF